MIDKVSEREAREVVASFCPPIQSEKGTSPVLKGGAGLQNVRDQFEVLRSSREENHRVERERLSSLVEMARSLKGLSVEEAVVCCMELRRELERFISEIQEFDVVLRGRKVEMGERLISLRCQCSLFQQEVHEYEERRGKLEVEEEGLRSKYQHFEEELKSLKSEKKGLKGLLKKEKNFQSQAKIDWIPGVGFFRGLKTRDYKRMIPFRTVVKGIRSRIYGEQELRRRIERKRAECKKTRSQLRSCKRKKFDQGRKIELVKEAIRRLETSMDSDELRTKKLGVEIVGISDRRALLSELLGKYKFLQEDVNHLADLIRRGHFEKIGKQEVDYFIGDIQRIQDFHLASSTC